MDKNKMIHIYKKINPILFDVSLRDGLQGLSKYEQSSITLEAKEKIYNNICFLHEPTNIEIGSVVNPKILPVMANSLELFRDISLKNTKITKHTSYLPNLYMLAPNKKGYTLAINYGITNFSFLTSVSESFQKKNVNKTIEETKNELIEIMHEINKICNLYLPNELKTKLYISCLNECPIEGKINNNNVVNEIIYYSKNMNMHEFCL